VTTGIGEILDGEEGDDELGMLKIRAEACVLFFEAIHDQRAVAIGVAEELGQVGRLGISDFEGGIDEMVHGLDSIAVVLVSHGFLDLLFVAGSLGQ
jgi:hypothetical protein